MRELLRQIFTGADGQTQDFARLIGVVAGLSFVIMGFKSCWTATDLHPFDFQGFGIGFGSMAAGIGALLFAKKDTEPKGEQTATKDKTP